MLAYKSHLINFLIPLIIVLLLVGFEISSNTPLYAHTIRIEQKLPLQEELIEYLINNSKSRVIIPIGRPSSLINDIKVSLNGEPVEPEFSKDLCGAFWINFSLYSFYGDTEIRIERINKNEKKIMYYDNAINRTQWLQPSKFIDSDNSTLIIVANDIIQNHHKKLEKAYIIFNYVHKEIEGKETNVPDLNASTVYDWGYGVCEDQARLFIALCRAVGIPSRTIEGFACVDSSPYNNLHMWAEILDDEGYWHPVCPTWGYFDYQPPQFFDQIYAYHQNTFKTNTSINKSSSTISIRATNEFTKINWMIMDPSRIFDRLFDCLSIFLAVFILLEISFFWRRRKKSLQDEEIHSENNEQHPNKK